MGHLLEPIAAYWYQQKTGNTVYNDTNLYQHADHPWALVDFDLRFVRKEDLLCVQQGHPSVDAELSAVPYPAAPQSLGRSCP